MCERVAIVRGQTGEIGVLLKLRFRGKKGGRCVEKEEQGKRTFKWN
jgi:hypothetical protein